jgi:small-conductance mechanosensitive channel
MEFLHLKMLESIIAVGIYLLLRAVTNKIIDKTVATSFVQKTRAKIIKKVLNIFWLFLVSVFILIVWGIDQNQLAFFFGSVLTVIGVAFFAQWSILSNITSGIILFFNHSVKLDDTIRVMDKDYEIEGRVSDIGLFFVNMTTSEGEKVTIPNNVFIQKMIKRKPNA